MALADHVRQQLEEARCRVRQLRNSYRDSIFTMLGTQLDRASDVSCGKHDSWPVYDALGLDCLADMWGMPARGQNGAVGHDQIPEFLPSIEAIQNFGPAVRKSEKLKYFDAVQVLLAPCPNGVRLP